MSGLQKGALPNLIVIGAQKCGTSSLHYYLDLHPEIQMSSPKELQFFIAEDGFDPEPFLADPGDLRFMQMNAEWSLGRSWYEAQFDPEVPVRGESSPVYGSPWHRRVADRMAGLIPDARLIYLVRDPIERIVSSYMHFRADGRERRSLSEAASAPIYVGRSRYMTVLRPFLERYPRERILILRQEDLLMRRRETLGDVFRWLGVDPGFWSPKMERERNVSGRIGRRFAFLMRIRNTRLARVGYRLPQEAKWVVERLNGSRGGSGRPTVDPELRQELLEELDPEIAGLEELTGWDLSAWRAPQPARAEV